MKPCSFIDFLRGWGEHTPPRLRYTDAEDFAVWQSQFREKILDLLGPVPDRVEPAVDWVETVEEPDHTRYLLRIPVSAFSVLPAYLLAPRDLKPGENRPGLLASHGHARRGMENLCGIGNGREPVDEGRAYALSAVRSGYVVMVPGWWGWPGRDGHVDRIGNRDKCNVIQMAASMYGISVLALHIQDAGAALDVLASWNGVDGDRIGCLGNSYGGRTAMWYTVFDNRIKACVSSGAMNTFRERSLKLSSCGIQYPPGILRYGDVPEIYSLIAPRPLQLQTGEGDALITPSDRDHIEATVRRAYTLLGSEDRFSTVFHGDGHRLLWEHAAPFFRHHLRDPARGKERAE